MEIILVRHTTPNIEKGICYGQSDLELADTYTKEIIAVLQQLPNNLQDYECYSSPLQRCKLLAQKISNTVIFDDRLKELNFGDWELKNWNDIDRIPLDKWMNNFVTEPTLNGESYIELHQRTTDFITEVYQQKKQKIILVTHAGVIRSIYSYIHKKDLVNSFDLKLKYGEILTLTL